VGEVRRSAAVTEASEGLSRVGRVPSSPTRTATLRNAVGLGVAVGLYGTAFGAAAASVGLSALQALTLSLLMFTGASQFALIGVLGAGGSALAALGSAWLLGTRNTVYGVRLVPLLSPKGALRRMATAHWVIDETTALAVAASDRSLARLAFLAGGAALFTLWNVTTFAGALGAAALGPTARAALDAVVPAAFLGLLWPRLRPAFPEAARQRLVALGGAGVALALTPVLPPGVQVISAVLAVGLAGRPRASEVTE
jgi:predicted branched-subunit amino acid permease